MVDVGSESLGMEVDRRLDFFFEAGSSGEFPSNSTLVVDWVGTVLEEEGADGLADVEVGIERLAVKGSCVVVLVDRSFCDCISSDPETIGGSPSVSSSRLGGSRGGGAGIPRSMADLLR